jgi:hypothetical protein
MVPATLAPQELIAVPESLAAPLALAALVVAVIALFAAVAVFARGRSKPEPRPLPAMVDADALESYLSGMQQRIDRISGESDSMEARISTTEKSALAAVQKVGMVRYNPFDDTGSNQSFALALLDGNANGIILSSLHSRQQTRLYVKEIVAGRSEVALSDEETEALKRAGVSAS